MDTEVEWHDVDGLDLLLLQWKGIEWLLEAETKTRIQYEDYVA